MSDTPHFRIVLSDAMHTCKSTAVSYTHSEDVQMNNTTTNTNDTTNADRIALRQRIERVIQRYFEEVADTMPDNHPSVRDWLRLADVYGRNRAELVNALMVLYDKHSAPAVVMKCADCGDTIEDGDEHEHDDEMYCPGCVCDCINCGERLPMEVAREEFDSNVPSGDFDSDEYLCEDCGDQCAECGERFLRDNLTERGDDYLCEDCTTECASCNERHKPSTMYSVDGIEHCRDCIDDVLTEQMTDLANRLRYALIDAMCPQPNSAAHPADATSADVALRERIEAAASEIDDTIWTFLPFHV